MNKLFNLSIPKDVTYGRGYVYSLQYHIVWVTKYRKPIFVGDIEADVKQYLLETLKSLDMTVLAMEIMPDHIHLLVDCKPQLKLSDAIKVLKGNTAKRLHILSNRETRITSVKSEGKQSVRRMGDISLNVKPVPCCITDENYKILQVADYMGGYNNQNYPILNDDEIKIMADYIADIPKSVINTTLSYFSKDVKQKVLDLINL